jgi:hypothetical protein
MHTTATVLALVGTLGIIGIGLRFLLRPDVATRGYGVAPDDVRAFTAIKGLRDITSGIVPLVAWAAGGSQVLGWVLVAAALTAAGDAVIVRARGGALGTALGVHGLTAAVLVAVGLVLALG